MNNFKLLNLSGRPHSKKSWEEFSSPLSFILKFSRHDWFRAHVYYLSLLNYATKKAHCTPIFSPARYLISNFQGFETLSQGFKTLSQGFKTLETLSLPLRTHSLSHRTHPLTRHRRNNPPPSTTGASMHKPGHPPVPNECMQAPRATTTTMLPTTYVSYPYQNPQPTLQPDVTMVPTPRPALKTPYIYS